MVKKMSDVDDEGNGRHPHIFHELIICVRCGRRSFVSSLLYDRRVPSVIVDAPLFQAQNNVTCLGALFVVQTSTTINTKSNTLTWHRKTLQSSRTSCMCVVACVRAPVDVWALLGWSCSPVIQDIRGMCTPLDDINLVKKVSGYMQESFLHRKEQDEQMKGELKRMSVKRLTCQCNATDSKSHAYWPTNSLDKQARLITAVLPASRKCSVPGRSCSDD